MNKDEMKMIEEIEKEQPIAMMIQGYLDNNDIKVSHSLLPLHIEDMLTRQNYRKIADDEIVIKKSEYEKIKSLYDTQKGAIMTSSIGDLPLTIEGLRKSVDEIDRARNAEREAQELCEKYYNEAKDLKRELKRVEQETAREILALIGKPNYKGDDWYEGAFFKQEQIREQIADEYGIELED